MHTTRYVYMEKAEEDMGNLPLLLSSLLLVVVVMCVCVSVCTCHAVHAAVGEQFCGDCSFLPS